jgi:hypothetical protein
LTRGQYGLFARFFIFSHPDLSQSRELPSAQEFFFACSALSRSWAFTTGMDFHQSPKILYLIFFSAAGRFSSVRQLWLFYMLLLFDDFVYDT